MRKTLFLFVLVFQTSFGQNPFYYSLDKSDGLPSNSVYDIFQDKKGFMWFATGKGLCRYDGSLFTVFTSDDQTSKSGSCISEDQFGRIWYSNFDGYLYYIENGILKSLPQSESVGYFKYGITKKHLYVLQQKGVAVYNLKTLKLISTINVPDENYRSTFMFNDNFYVLSDDLYVIKDLKIDHKINLNPIVNAENFEAPVLQKTSDGLLLTSKFSRKYYLLNNESLIQKIFSNEVSFVQNSAIIENTLWFCTPNGIVRHNLINDKDKIYFTEHNISYIFKDRQGNFWISTLNNGILFIQDFENNFIPVDPKPTVLSRTKSSVLIGTENEIIYELDLKTRQISTAFKTSNNHPINQLIVTENGKTLFTSSQFKSLTNQAITRQYSLAVKDVKKVDDRFYSFAASGQSGLIDINPNAESKWIKTVGKCEKNKYIPKEFTCFLSGSNGKSTAFNSFNSAIYYATNVGLKSVSDEKSETLLFKKRPLYLINLQSYEDKIIGLSTSELLYQIDSDNTVSRFPLPENLVRQRFYKFKIQQNSLYLFCKNGILDYDLKTKTSRKILPVSDDMEVSDLLVIDDLIYFATSNGIIIKDRFRKAAFLNPHLIVNDIKVNGQKVKERKLSDLQYFENEIAVNFSVLSFIPNEKYGILYKLNDKDWHRLNPENKNLVLSALAPGNYDLQIKLDSANQEPIRIIRFSIDKPFWLTNVFLIVAALIFLCFIVLIFRYQVSKIKKNNQLVIDKINLEKNLNQSTLKAIKSQMNPHFFYNALNTIQSYILSNDKKQAVNYLSKFSTLTRTILEMSEKETISISEEIKTISLYLDIEKARFNEDFHYEIDTTSVIEMDDFRIPAMLLQPYIENAVKHGLLHKNGFKQLKITFENREHYLKICIEDNGIGRAKSMELNAIKAKNHQSFATEAMQNRIDLLNKNKVEQIVLYYVDKQNSANQPTGTTVVIIIPKKQRRTMTAIIIDDEKRARVSLSLILQEYCPDVKLLAECENLPEGVKAIRKHNPDIVLLDIEMPGHSGLELLDFFNENEITFAIIFTTAYNEFAIQAFKLSAVDYLLKPIVPDELMQAISRVQKVKLHTYKVLAENIQSEVFDKIAVPSGNSLILLKISEILYIKGEGSYSDVFMCNGGKHLVSRNLKNFEEILVKDSRFVRTHKSYLVNFDAIIAFNKSDGGWLDMINGASIPVSPDKSGLLLDRIKVVKR